VTYEEFVAVCDKHNVEYKAALEEIVTTDYVTEAMKSRINVLREKDKYLSELHGHFTLEQAKVKRAERSVVDEFGFSEFFTKKTELS
jgi:hypothetical protein